MGEPIIMGPKCLVAKHVVVYEEVRHTESQAATGQENAGALGEREPSEHSEVFQRLLTLGPTRSEGQPVQVRNDKRVVLAEWMRFEVERQLWKELTVLGEAYPNAIIRNLKMLRPIYAQTAAYGHFGRTDLDLPWGRTDRVDTLKATVGG